MSVSLLLDFAWALSVDRRIARARVLAAHLRVGDGTAAVAGVVVVRGVVAARDT